MSVVDVAKVFEKKRPVCVMAQMVLDRLLGKEAIDALFHEVADEQYQRELLFSCMARLMASVTLGREPSVNAAYRKLKDEAGVSLNALYGKLGRVETSLSQALVRFAYAQSREIGEQMRAGASSCLRGYRVKILDGNHLAASEHRLQETRGSTAAPLPGKSLVVLDPQYEAIADLFPIEDGHAQERSALDRVIETIERGDLWIADRNFCTLKFIYAIAALGGKFVIRLHSMVEGTLLGRRRSAGKTDTGNVFEGKMELPPCNGVTLVVRRVEVELIEPTRDGDQAIVLLTNLPEDKADAVKVAELYRKRWRIETAFQKLTTTLQCEVNTLCYPKAALFAFALACVAYNAVAVVLLTIRAQHGQAHAENVSFYYIGLEIAQAHDGMMVAIPADYWDKISNMPLNSFVSRLLSVARQIDLTLYRKAKRSPKKPPPKLKHQKREVHVSSAKILAARQQ